MGIKVVRNTTGSAKQQQPQPQPQRKPSGYNKRPAQQQQGGSKAWIVWVIAGVFVVIFIICVAVVDNSTIILGVALFNVILYLFMLVIALFELKQMPKLKRHHKKNNRYSFY